MTLNFSFTYYLVDEERICDITKNLSEIDLLAGVLDGEYFQGISNLLYELIFIRNTEIIQNIG